MEANNKLISNAPSVSVIDPSYIDTRLDASYYAPVAIKTYEKVINSGLPWKSVKKSCSKINSGPFGSSLLASQYVETGVPFFRPLNIKDIIADTTQLVFISDEDWVRLRSSQFVEGDILITKIGNGIGDVGVLPKGVKKANISGNLMGIRLKPQYNPYFAVTYFKSSVGQILISRALTNTAKPKLGSYDLVNIPIILPESKIQNYIGQKVDIAEKCKSSSANIQRKLGKSIKELYQNVPSIDAAINHTMVSIEEFDNDRMDAWHYQRHYIDLHRWLKRKGEFHEVLKIASLSKSRWNPKNETNFEFTYIEISNIDTTTSALTPNVVKVCDAPSRARKLLKSYDVLVSTVRPNRGAISVVPKELDGAVASTGFAVLRTNSKEDAYFLGQILKHPVSIAQLMRWNTGSTYPAIEEDVVLKIWVPGANEDLRNKIGKLEMKRYWLQEKSSKLINEAKSDVEALIEGKLDTGSILSGKLKAPTWEDIEKELEGI